MGKEAYRYDGHGRRVLANSEEGLGAIRSLYGNDGVLRYQWDDRRAKVFNYVYLAGSLIATRETPYNSSTNTIKYQHTDALGSPVAVTSASQAVLERNEYEPYGKVIAPASPQDGPGYTGHVFDAATGLNYMQQRYYDPAIGRFLSVDPVTANGATGGNFNRYWYANNNPYKFTDPDGRMVSDLRDIDGRRGGVCHLLNTCVGKDSKEQAKPKDDVQASLLQDRLDNYVEIDHVAGVVDKSIEKANAFDRIFGNAGNWTKESGQRYIYTQRGWIDLKHVTGAATLPFGEQLGKLFEMKQQLSGSYSAWMQEDLTSNEIGASALNLSMSMRGLFSIGQSSQLLINGYHPYTEEQARMLLTPGGD